MSDISVVLAATRLLPANSMKFAKILQDLCDMVPSVNRGNYIPNALNMSQFL